VGRLSVLVERLLALASDGTKPLTRDAVAMEDVVREVVLARSESDRARVETSCEGPGMVRGDETLLRVLVDNLVDNALKFSKDKPVVVRVEETDGSVCLVVKDEGPGIDPGDVERLMQPFVRGSDQGVPGHGLGLAIVAHAARLHEGDVRLAPRDGGAELRVTLPGWTPDQR
jgi:signal transduction histidine kinase